MRPKWSAPATACALVVATSGGCGGGGSKADPAAESFAFPAGAATDTAGSAAAAAFMPGYAVTGMVDLRVGKAPIAVAVNPQTNKIYVLNNKSDNVTVIDGKTRKTTTVAVGPEPGSITVNKATNKIYVTNLRGLNAQGAIDANGNGSVTVIDGATNKPTTVPAGLEPFKAAVNEKTNKIYVANQGSNDVTVIDGKTNKTKTVALRKDSDSLTEGVLSPQDVQVNQVTDKIYVTGPQSNTVAAIDGKTNKFTVLSTQGERGDPPTPFGLTPTYLAVDGTRNTIYIANSTSNDVTVIDGKTNETSNESLVDVQDPYAIAVNEKTNKIYLANQTSKSVTVIDGETKKAITIGDLPGKPHDVAINPITNKIYFPMFVTYRGAAVGDDKQITGLLLELDGATNEIHTVIAGITPYAVAVNPNTNEIWVISQDSNTVSVLAPTSGGKGQAARTSAVSQ